MTVKCYSSRKRYKYHYHITMKSQMHTYSLLGSEFDESLIFSWRAAVVKKINTYMYISMHANGDLLVLS
jgi:hypothetical protein